jgi:hypothetical protein
VIVALTANKLVRRRGEHRRRLIIADFPSPPKTKQETRRAVDRLLGMVSPTDAAGQRPTEKVLLARLPQGEILSAIVRGTGVDVYFRLVVDGTLEKLRLAMAAPPAGVDARVDAEFEAIRQQLGKFYPEYEQVYGGTLARHLSRDQLEEVASLLQNTVLPEYFRATREMSEMLVADFEELESRMLLHARYRSVE